MKKVNMMKTVLMSLVLVFAYAPTVSAEDIVKKAAEEIRTQAQAEAIKVTDGNEEFAGEAHESIAHSDEGHDDHGGGHGHVELDKQDWSFSGPFGTYDRGALQRGFQVYKQVCAACHSMKYLSYRNLSDLGYSEAQIKAIAGEYSTMDGPDGEGEMFERPMRPSDRFKSPYTNDNQARYANNGALPPDLSLIAKARKGGADYVYNLLVGYDEPPEGITIAEGQHYNRVMAGNKIAMAAPLADDMVGYEDDSPTTMEQYSKDVSHFLMWAAEPKMEIRKQTGIKVVLFLFVFAGIMYAVKRKIWADVKKK